MKIGDEFKQCLTMWNEDGHTHFAVLNSLIIILDDDQKPKHLTGDTICCTNSKLSLLCGNHIIILEPQERDKVEKYIKRLIRNRDYRG